MINNIIVRRNRKYMAVESTKGCDGCAFRTAEVCRVLTHGKGIESCLRKERPDGASTIYKHYIGRRT